MKQQNIYIILLICVLISVIICIFKKFTDIDFLIYGKSIYEIIPVILLVIIKVCDKILTKLDEKDKQ